jgi:hypothetical protein
MARYKALPPGGLRLRRPPLQPSDARNALLAGRSRARHTLRRYTSVTAPNPLRKGDLLLILAVELGPDLHRRELSVAELEAIAAEHGIDVSKAPSVTRKLKNTDD